MPRHTSREIRRDALQIWRAAVDAVLPQRLVSKTLRVEGSTLVVGDETIPLGSIRRIAVVGAGSVGRSSGWSLSAV